MPEFLELLSPDEAKKKILDNLSDKAFQTTVIPTQDALGYVIC